MSSPDSAALDDETQDWLPDYTPQPYALWTAWVRTVFVENGDDLALSGVGAVIGWQYLPDRDRWLPIVHEGGADGAFVDDRRVEIFNTRPEAEQWCAIERSRSERVSLHLNLREAREEAAPGRSCAMNYLFCVDRQWQERRNGSDAACPHGAPHDTKAKG